METIPTAEEWLKNNYEANAINPNILIEFAKLHVTEALKQGADSAYLDSDCKMYKSIIINAYPLTNIK
jgi:hypothetical protein